MKFENEPCLYVGSMTEHHGEGTLSGPTVRAYGWIERTDYTFTPKGSDSPVLNSPNLSSFVLNTHS